MENNNMENNNMENNNMENGGMENGGMENGGMENGGMENNNMENGGMEKLAEERERESDWKKFKSLQKERSYYDKKWRISVSVIFYAIIYLPASFLLLSWLDSKNYIDLNVGGRSNGDMQAKYSLLTLGVAALVYLFALMFFHYYLAKLNQIEYQISEWREPSEVRIETDKSQPK